jgi:hypothetical protein
MNSGLKKMGDSADGAHSKFSKALGMVEAFTVGVGIGTAAWQAFNLLDTKKEKSASKTSELVGTTLSRESMKGMSDSELRKAISTAEAEHRRAGSGGIFGGEHASETRRLNQRAIDRAKAFRSKRMQGKRDMKNMSNMDKLSVGDRDIDFINEKAERFKSKAEARAAASLDTALAPTTGGASVFGATTRGGDAPTGSGVLVNNNIVVQAENKRKYQERMAKEAKKQADAIYDIPLF